jgi:superfamily II DNA or RNA helicase
MIVLNPAVSNAPFGDIDPATGQIIADLVAKLRPYQNTGMRISRDLFYQSGCRRQLLVNPTGTGKTVFFATLPIFHQFKRRILVLVHRDTLAKQAKKKIEFWNPDVKVGVEQGTQHTDGTERVVVGSVQTLGRPKRVPIYGRPGKCTKEPNKRLLALNPDDFDAVIIDEAHHSIAASYKRILQHFGFLDAKFEKTNPAPNRLLLGVTATPKRGDGARLDQVYDKKIYEYFLDEAIREGWLVNIRCLRIKTTSSLDDVHKLGGEFKKDELAKAVNTPARNRRVVDAWLQYASDRPTIAFGVDIAHAQALAEEFRKRNIRCVAIWDGDPDEEESIESFSNGELDVLVNVEKLTEGFDVSRVSCVLLARPTASEAMFKQMVGRGTRLEDGISNLLEALAQGRVLAKPDCLVLDVTDATSKHTCLVNFAGAYGLPLNLDLNGGGFLEAHDTFERIKDEAKNADPAVLVDPAQFETLEDMQTYLQDLTPLVAEEVDLLQVRFEDEVVCNSQLQWHKLGVEQYALMLPRQKGHAMGTVFLSRDPDGFHVLEGELDAPLHSFKEVGKRRNRPFGEGFAYADAKVYSLFGANVVSLCDRRLTDGWRTKPASPAQRSALEPSFRAKGKEVPPELTKGEASLLITRLQVELNLSSPRARKPFPAGVPARHENVPAA